MAVPFAVGQKAMALISEGLSLMECPICMNESERQLVTLICGHNICQTCELKLPHHGNQIQCPSCKMVTILPPGGLRGNFLLASVVSHLDDALRQLKQMSGGVLRQTRTISDLPAKALRRVFQYVSLKDIILGHLVCRRWHKVISNYCSQLPKMGKEMALLISFNGQKQCAEVCFDDAPLNRDRAYTVPLDELSILAKKLQHFIVTSIDLHLFDFTPDVLATVVDQLRQPALAHQLASLTFHSVRDSALVPILKTLLLETSVLRHLRLNDVHPCVMPFITDDVILSPGTGGRLIELCIQRQVPVKHGGSQSQGNVTDAIFDAVDVANFDTLSLEYCPRLTVNGLHLFLQRWLNAGGQESSMHCSLLLTRCTQLTPVGVEQLCRRLPVTVQINATGLAHRDVTITHRSQQRSMCICVNPIKK